MSLPNNIIIFDTTLRDGEQSPGASLNIQEKVEIARQLTRLCVDVIEAGFPVSSPVQFEAVEQIANSTDVVVAGLARAVEKDIKIAHAALANAQRARIHTFIGTSDIHIMEKFRDSSYGTTLAEKRATVVEMIKCSVEYAKSLCDDVEFSAEDAGRTDTDYLAEVLEVAIAAGANTVNIPDTTGFTMPAEFGAKIESIKGQVSNIDQAVISAHCHNDLGLAVANSLAAIQAGARQVECTINGIGERAGNASLEEIVMALKVREDYWGYNTNVKAEEIFNTSKMVSAFTGLIVQPNKAIVGDNAFSHEAGIHQDGMLKSSKTYEIIDPELIGKSMTRIVLGRHSGRHGLIDRLKSLGYHPEEVEIQRIYERFVELADKKKEVFDDDLRVLMGDEIHRHDEHYRLIALQVSAGTTSLATGTVSVEYNGERINESAIGDGPVDACFKAIDRALGTDYRIESYRVRSITAGRGAQGEVLVRVRNGDEVFMGRGISTDIIEASVLAYLGALNKAQDAAIAKSAGALLAAETN
ncbi:2-isopropylmalate synthase [Candidatus Neomarinimicrobiota bacterium]